MLILDTINDGLKICGHLLIELKERARAHLVSKVMVVSKILSLVFLYITLGDLSMLLVDCYLQNLHIKSHTKISIFEKSMWI